MLKRLNFPKPFFYLLFIFLFLLFLSLLGLFKPIKGAAEKIMIIPAKEQVFKWQRFFKKDLGGCELKNDKEITDLKTQISSLQEENLKQKRLLSAPLPKNWQFLTARVVGLNGEVLTINIGRKEGVKENMAVIDAGTYLGKTFKVSEEISQVKLASFWEEKSVVKIISEENGEILGKGLLVGTGQGRIKIEQILLSVNAKKGDLAVISVESGDLSVGKIEEVNEVKGDPFKTASVKRLFNPEELEIVFVVKGGI